VRVVSVRLPDEVYAKIELRVEAGLGTESEVVREAVSKGLDMNDTTLTRIQVESLCLMRRLVATKDPDLFQKAKDDAAVVLKQLGVN